MLTNSSFMYLAILLFATMVNGALPRTPQWGSSPLTIKNTESGVFRESMTQDSIVIDIYEDTIMSMPAEVVYYFKDSILCNVGCWMNPEYSMFADYLECYRNIRDYLICQYDTTEVEGSVWFDNTFAGDQEYLGYAMGQGHWYKYVDWNTEKELINFTLRGTEGDIFLQLLYTSHEYSELWDRTSE